MGLVVGDGGLAESLRTTYKSRYQFCVGYGCLSLAEQANYAACLIRAAFLGMC